MFQWYPPAPTTPISFPTKTFATLGAPIAQIAYLVTDIGTNGVVYFSDGNIWQPIGGSAVIAQAAPNIVVSGSTSISVSLPFYPASGFYPSGAIQTQIPAAALGANGQLELITNFSANNSANDKTIYVELGSVHEGPALIYSMNMKNNTNLNVNLRICNNNSQTSQIIFNAGTSTVPGQGGFGLDTSTTYSIPRDTGSYPPFVYIYGKLTNSGDSLTLISYRLGFYPHG